VIQVNVLLLLAAVFALFIAADILTAKLFKVKRTAPRNVSLCALCVLALSAGIGGAALLARSADTTARTLYNAYSYLLDGDIDKAAENASRAQSPHSDVILLLADGWRGHYASVFINADDLKNSGSLNEDLFAQVDSIYRLARQMTGLDGAALTDGEAGSRLTDIAKNCFSLLEISEKSEVEFLSGFRRERMLNSENYYEVDPQILGEMLLQASNDRELLRYSVKYFNAAGGLDTAEENARRLLDADRSAENIVLYTDVIAQKLLNNVSIMDYDENDSEIASLLKRAEDAEEASDSYDEGNPRRKDSLARAEDYRRQANGVKARRIINWLTAQSPLFGDKSGVIALQLSKLYDASGDDAKAREILMELLKQADGLSDGSPIKSA
jgi:hypothetical protein